MIVSLDKFLVLKTADIDRYLTELDKEKLAEILLKVHDGRNAEGKKINRYLVVNMDEPYALVVSEMIAISQAEEKKNK